MFSVKTEKQNILALFSKHFLICKSFNPKTPGCCVFNKQDICFKQIVNFTVKELLLFFFLEKITIAGKLMQLLDILEKICHLSKILYQVMRNPRIPLHIYCIYSAIRWGFHLSRMTTNNLISSM